MAFQDGTRKEHFLPEVGREMETTLALLEVAEVHSGKNRVIHNTYAERTDATDTTNGAYTASDADYESENMVINREAVKAEKVRNMDELQANFNVAMDKAKDFGYALSTKIDKYGLGKVVTRLEADASDQVITTGAITEANVLAKFAEMKAELPTGSRHGRFAIVKPSVETAITVYSAGKGLNFGDDVLKNGFIGKFGGFDVIVSDNLPAGVEAIFGHKKAIQLGLPKNGSDFEKISIPNFTGKEFRSVQVYEAEVWSQDLNRLAVAKTA